jgi:hypothetical protein
MSDDDLSALEQASADMREGRERKAAERAAKAAAVDKYLDQRWQARAREFLEANPFCLGCKTIGRTTKATVADHIVPVSRSSEDFLSAQLQPLCYPCHNSIKRKLEHAYRRGEIKAPMLKMDSSEARRLLGASMGCGVDGRPLDPRHPWSRKYKQVNDIPGG